MRDDPRLPSSPGFWRSPVRGSWFTSVLGLVLLVGITVLFVTGLVSYAAYNPNLAPVNDQTPDKGILGFYLFSWPTDPPWLYRLTQGTHVTLGITLIPVLLAKLWSVVPKLFALPPARSLAHALERVSLLLVGGALFEFTTGVLNIQLDYVFPVLQPHGAFRRGALRANQVADPRSLLALQANGEDLTPDHGYPARVIVPAAPGVLNTKWVGRMTFGDL
ncbi:molybdopterin-dependent oxidoreductase [Streptomyces sp. NPDC054794]